MLGSAGPNSAPEAALSEQWLASTDRSRAFYQALRDAFVPGRPIWVTETAEAACGGNPWASTFLDTFRYLDQLGQLARAGVQVVAHNTLAASDYGLLDERSLRPRPNYWAALLWRRLMGITVLDAGVHDGTHIYAHCRRAVPGAVTLLVINTDRGTTAAILRLPVPSERYTLSADHLQSTAVKLNGTALELGGNDLPDLAAVRSPPGPLEIAPATITFLSRSRMPETGHAIRLIETCTHDRLPAKTSILPRRTGRCEKFLRSVQLHQLLPLDQPEPVADIAHEIAVMRHDQATRLRVQQFFLERFLALDIQMVGRLVEQVEIRLGQPQHQHAEPRLLSAGEFSIGRPCLRWKGRRRKQRARALVADSKRRTIVRIGVSRHRDRRAPGRNSLLPATAWP